MEKKGRALEGLGAEVARDRARGVADGRDELRTQLPVPAHALDGAGNADRAHREPVPVEDRRGHRGHALPGLLQVGGVPLGAGRSVTVAAVNGSRLASTSSACATGSSAVSTLPRAVECIGCIAPTSRTWRLSSGRNTWWTMSTPCWWTTPR